MRDERVEEWCESLVGTSVEGFVVIAKVLFSKTFKNDNHHIHWSELGGIGRNMNWREDAFHLLLWHVVRSDERSLVECANDGKRRVEHDARFAGLVDILVGIADGDGASGCGEAATHTSNAERHYDGE